ncbi:uncharacterized PE-PGRS family protein PE_PGRS54-like [Anopheles maculipalpis]|uniref:uncharacterized PE-PGRS family protein PE_PGRS54-like n=1 Tax=Anopheles maculipalpis TaxID=1496333 RepID=UPI0021594106|nr:uncharacterized PE-PGRS family protein PE_PGRS54-like [Anopheles maculipalpis]
MLWRLGLLLGLCLVLARGEEDEVIKCTGGECVKLHLCPNGELNTDGANIIDIRFNPDNECEDYLLKCCPYPEDDEDIVPPPPSHPGTDTGATGPGTNVGPGTETGPAPTTVPGTGTGSSTIPPNQGTGPVQPIPGGAGQLGTGNKPTGTGAGIGGGGGGAKPHGHGQGQGYGGCRGDSSCSKPSSSSEGDEQAVLVGKDQIPSGGTATSANQVKEPGQVPQVHGGGPPVGGSGAPGSGSSGTNQATGGTGKPSTGGTAKPPVGTSTSSNESGVGQQTGGSGGSGGSTSAEKPGQQGGPAGSGAAQGSPIQKPGQQGTSGTGGAATQKPGQPVQPGAGGAGAAGGVPTQKPSQQGVGGTGGPATGGQQPVQPGAGGAGAAGGLPTQKPGQPGASGTGGPGGVVSQNPGQPGAGGSSGTSGGGHSGVPTQKPGQQGVGGPGGNTSPGQSGVTGLNVLPGSGKDSTPGKQPGGAGQKHPGMGGAQHPNVGGGYNSGVKGTQPDKIGSATQNPLDKTVEVPHKCGLRNVDGVGFRITGDNDGESEYGEFPWMVAILKEEKALDQVINLYQCGGSLIHPSVVLTAAHCVQNRKPEEVKVRLGEWDTQTKNEMFDYQDRNVVEIVSHAEFYKGGLFNDVALLFLDKPAELMETVNTICLPPANHNFDLSRCFASGWGKDVFGKQGTYQVILKKIELPIMPNEECQKALRTTRLGRRFKLHSSFICAGGEKGRDTCKGDGGSPLVCPIPGTINHYYQAGMVAWGIGCGEDGIPGVYVNVPLFRGWIDDHLRQRNITDSFYLYS